MLNFSNETLYQMKQTRPNCTFQTGEVFQDLGNVRVGMLGGGSTPEEVMPNSTYLYSSESGRAFTPPESCCVSRNWDDTDTPGMTQTPQG